MNGTNQPTARGILLRVVSWLFSFGLVAGLAVPAAAQSVTTAVNTTDGAVGSTQTCALPLVRNFTVTGSFAVTDVDLGIYVEHAQRGDIRVTLQAPNGTRVQLVDGESTISGDNLNVRLDDSASQVVNTDGATRNQSNLAPPFQNTFRPNSPLSAFNGIQANGTWRMEICDIRPLLTNGNFRHAELYITSAGADLSLTKVLVGSPPTAGSPVTWRLTVFSSFSSTATASGIAVRDILPSGFVLTGSSGDGNFNGSTGLWTVGSLAPGETAIMTITGTVTASAGTTITNVAEITASSLPDADSTVDNAVTTEDDYARSSFAVQSGRAAGIPPQLSCPAGFSVFDWGAISSWTPGSTDNTYALARFGNVRFRLTNDGVYQNLAAYGGQSPTVNSTMTGGLTPAEPSLTIVSDQANLTGVVEIAITLPRSFAGVQFSIFDVDFFSGQFADRVEIIGRLGGAEVLPVLTNGNANYLQGNVAIGDALSADSEPFGNLVVTFTAPVDTIVIRYGNHTTAPTNPGQQGIGLHDLIVCNPFTRLSVTKVSAVISDPVNLTNNPKAVPGALVEYLIEISNDGASATDPDSVVVLDRGPVDAKLCQVTRSGGPVIFNDPEISGLTYTFDSIASAIDSLEFSNNNGASWSYIPQADSQGCDAAVTDFRVRFGGSLSAGRRFNLLTRYIIE